MWNNVLFKIIFIIPGGKLYFAQTHSCYQLQSTAVWVTSLITHNSTWIEGWEPCLIELNIWAVSQDRPWTFQRADGFFKFSIDTSRKKRNNMSSRGEVQTSLLQKANIPISFQNFVHQWHVGPPVHSRTSPSVESCCMCVGEKHNRDEHVAKFVQSAEEADQIFHDFHCSIVGVRCGIDKIHHCNRWR